MKTYNLLSLFAGIGGGAIGFLAARHADGSRFRSCGAVDYEPAAARDFERLTGSRCHVGDLSTMQPADLAAVCDAPPDVLFSSPPCQGNSGCLPASQAATPKYQDMNALAVRGLFLTLEAWRTQPRLILMENVPRIQHRSRQLLDVIGKMLRTYGYTCRETVHDCGELGGLAQRRKRFLLVARLTSGPRRVSDWWREPVKQRVRGVGEVLGRLPIPLPGSTEGGPMHALPRLSAMNWLRLALIPAGGDWRDLPAAVRLDERPMRQNGGFGVEGWMDPAHAVLAEGTVRNVRASVADPRMGCEPRNGTMGVVGADEPAGTVLANLDIHAGASAVADPRPGYESRRGGHGVNPWGAPSRTVIGNDFGQKGAAVADPRLPGRFHGEHGVDGWEDPAGTVLGAAVTSKGANVADPRLSDRPGRHEAKYRVTDGAEPAGTVIASDRVGSGAPSVADPRVTCERNEGGHGVRRWDQPSACLIGAASIDNWPGQVADPRGSGHQIGRIVGTPEGPVLVGVTLDLADKRPLDRPPIILAADGTWHRPMTDLELAALQSLPTKLDGEWLVLTGNRARRRASIGNAVPPKAAEAIATTALGCLVASDSGAVTLSCDPVWVGPERRAMYATACEAAQEAPR